MIAGGINGLTDPGTAWLSASSHRA